MTAGMQPLDLAQQVLALVAGQAPQAEAEALVELSAHALTRFANSAIHQNMADASTLVRLHVHVAGRTAAGTTSTVDPDGLRGLVDRTLAAVAVCPPDPHWPGVAPPAPAPSTPDPDDAIWYAEPADRARRVRDFIDAAGGLETAGYCRSSRFTIALANTAGQAVQGRTAYAAMDGIARNAGSDGVARRCVGRLAELDGATLGARAAAKARAGVHPVELPPGRYEVVLEPTAVFDLLSAIAVFGLNGKAVNERRSFVELGAPMLDPAVTIVDDPARAEGTAMPFDLEGTPRPPVTFVDRGVCVAVAHDRRSAAQAGGRSTGHALVAPFVQGPIPTNLILEPSGRGNGGAGRAPSGRGADLAPSGRGADLAPSGRGADLAPSGRVPVDGDAPVADAAVAALVEQVERGLLVTDHWYTRVLDPRTLVLTGLTRNGVWLIEHGELTRPVQNLRFTQSYPQALAPGAVLGVGGSAVAVPADWGELRFRAPALRLAGWNYTGNARG
jgi:predicted Zn-dependent protease